LKTVIRQVPSELPHARLYIDDLVEIENLVKKLILDAENTNFEGFEYEIDETIRLTTHEELAEHRGSSSNFELIAVYSYFKGKPQRTTVIQFHGFLEPRLSFHWGGNEDRWATYAQVLQIFEPRKLRVKNFITAFPWYVGLILGSTIGYPIAALFAASFLNGVPHTLTSISEASCALILVLLYVFSFWNVFRTSRVLFRYVRLDFHERTQARKELFQKTVLLVIGAILGCLGAIATSYFKGH
jgi:hypothetical protein